MAVIDVEGGASAIDDDRERQNFIIRVSVTQYRADISKLDIEGAQPPCASSAGVGSICFHCAVGKTQHNAIGVCNNAIRAGTAIGLFEAQVVMERDFSVGRNEALTFRRKKMVIQEVLRSQPLRNLLAVHDSKVFREVILTTTNFDIEFSNGKVVSEHVVFNDCANVIDDDLPIDYIITRREENSITIMCRAVVHPR